MSTTLLLPAIFLPIALAASPFQAPEPQPFPLDPVALVAGREAAGKPDLSVDRHVYRYTFESAANRDAFLKEPERFEIQQGGACGRMGPLSGSGATSRFALHDGRIFIFASDQCRDAFLKSPATFLEAPEQPPAATPESSAAANALLDKAEAWMGGAPALNAAKSLQLSRRTTTRTDAGDRIDTRLQAFVFPDRLAVKDTWGDSWSSTVLSGSQGWFAGATYQTPMSPTQVEALRRSMSRNPLVIMKSRREPGFITTSGWRGLEKTSFTDDAGTIHEVALITVALNGATSGLGIDPTSGRIRTMQFTGRGSRAAMGDMRIIFTEVAESANVKLPSGRQVWFNGERAPALDQPNTKVEINEPVPEDLFKG